MFMTFLTNNIMKDVLTFCLSTKEMHRHKHLNHSQVESGLLSLNISSSHLSFLLDCYMIGGKY